MKKFTFIFLYLFITISAFSQTDIGIQSGITLSRLNGYVNTKNSHAFLTGFSMGGIVNTHIAKQFNLFGGLFFERTGSRVNEYKGDPNGAIMYHLDYLSMPLIACYDFGQKKSFGVGAGAFGSYLLSQKIFLDYGFGNGWSEGYQIVDFKNLNVGLAVKAYYQFQFKNKLLVVGMEDHLGLADMMTTPTAQKKTTTHCMNIFAAFQFRTGNRK